MRRITLLPNLLTLANAFCGVLAISKGIDALALSEQDPAIFYVKMESAALLVFLGMVFDALDGKVARFTGGASRFGSQIDSLADMLTFGCAPALLAKVLIEHEGPLVGYLGNPRLHFLAAAAFALMAILRLARFNLETDVDDSHVRFRGLPSPAAAGSVASTILVYLSLSRRELEVSEGMPTPMGWFLDNFGEELRVTFPPWFFTVFALLLPALGLLMVSRVEYVHVLSALTRRSHFFALVGFVFGAMALFAAPVPVLFLCFNGFVVFGVLRSRRERRLRRRREEEAERSLAGRIAQQ